MKMHKTHKLIQNAQNAQNGTARRQALWRDKKGRSGFIPNSLLIMFVEGHLGPSTKRVGLVARVEDKREPTGNPYVATTTIREIDGPVTVRILSIEGGHWVVWREVARGEHQRASATRARVRLGFDRRQPAIIIQDDVGKVIVAAAEGGCGNARAVKDRHGSAARRCYLDRDVADPSVADTAIGITSRSVTGSARDLIDTEIQIGDRADA